jgi:hypothetical protein
MLMRACGLMCASLAMAFLTSVCRAQTVSIVSNGKTTELTRTQIFSLPHVTVTVSSPGGPARFDGVPLSALLASAGIDMGYGLHGLELTKVVLVEAADGEQTTFSLAEIDPTFSGNNVILADHQNGKELSIREWPRIIGPADKRMDRWLPQVAKLSIVVVR